MGEVWETLEEDEKEEFELCVISEYTKSELSAAVLEAYNNKDKSDIKMGSSGVDAIMMLAKIVDTGYGEKSAPEDAPKAESKATSGEKSQSYKDMIECVDKIMKYSSDDRDAAITIVNVNCNSMADAWEDSSKDEHLELIEYVKDTYTKSQLEAAAENGRKNKGKVGTKMSARGEVMLDLLEELSENK